MSNGRGRPSKFTPEVASRVLDAVKLGALLQDAAAFAGIAPATLSDWLNHPATEELQAFSEAVARERASVKVQTVGKILLATKKNWQAGAWWLGVTDPVNYGPKIRVTLEEEFTGAIERIEKLGLAPEVFEQVLTAIAGGRGGPEAPGHSLEEGRDGSGPGPAPGLHPEDEPALPPAGPSGGGGEEA